MKIDIGGGVDFMRPWVEQAYGISSDQVVGSSGKVKYEVKERDTGLSNFQKRIDDKERKPVGIHQFIDKLPAFTAVNADGDYAT